MPNITSKYKFVAQLGSYHVRRDMGKDERVEVQQSLHITGGSTGYGYSITTGWRKITRHSMFNNG
jgi:hypothetical protein